MSPLLRTALVFVGSGLGGSLRYWLSLALKTQAALPWPTFAINATGSFLIGLALGIVAEKEPLRLFIVVGVLGGFTTFSAFSYETLVLLRERNLVPALAYAVGSVVVGLLAAVLGVAIVQHTGARSA